MQLEKQEQESLLNKFLMLGAFFKREELDKQRQEKIALKQAKMLEKQRKKEDILQKQALIVQVDQLLEAQLYDTVMMMMKSGYQLDQKQFHIMTLELDTVLENHHMKIDEKLSVLDKWLSKGWSLHENQAINLLFDDDFQKMYAKTLISGSKIKQYPFISEQISYYLSTEKFAQLYFESWKQRIELIEPIAANASIKSIVFTVREHHSYLFRSIKDMPSFLKVCQLYSSVLDKSASNFFTKINPDYLSQEKEFINQLLHSYFPDGVNKLINTTLNVFTTERIEQNLVQQQKNTVNSMHGQNVESLPAETNQLLEQIQSAYKYVLDNKQSLSVEQNFDIENLIEKKIPEILNKYISMHPDYRDSFSNKDGKTAKDLMHSSLDNIKEYFNHLMQELNLDKMHSLSAMERYTGNFK